jgi:hypothetical protein
VLDRSPRFTSEWSVSLGWQVFVVAGELWRCERLHVSSRSSTPVMKRNVAEKKFGTKKRAQILTVKTVVRLTLRHRFILLFTRNGLA